MVISAVILWCVLMAVFLAMEAFTVALITIWFAAGSLAALLAALVGGPFWLQVLLFLAVSSALLALLRPVMRKHMKITKTNSEALIGTCGLVTRDIDNIAATGEAKFGAMTWTARSSAGTPIPAGTMVRADRIEGVKLFVTPVPADRPEEKTV